MSHHHHKYYEREDGFVYSPEELDAYRVPQQKRNRCVNFFVPLLKCREYKNKRALFSNLPTIIDEAYDQWGGKCYKEVEDYKQCLHHYVKGALAAPVRNIYHINPSYASQQGVSAEFEKNFHTSPTTL